MQLSAADRPSVFLLILAALGSAALFIPHFGFLLAPAICVIFFAYVSDDSKKRLLITTLAPILGLVSVWTLWRRILPDIGDISLALSLCLIVAVPYVVFVWRAARKKDSATLLTAVLCLFVVVFIAWWQANNVQHCNIISVAEKGVAAKDVQYCQRLGLYVPGRSDAFLGWPEGARNILILPTAFAVTLFAFFVLLGALKTAEFKKSGKENFLVGLTVLCVVASTAILVKSVLPFIARISSETPSELPASQVSSLESKPVTRSLADAIVLLPSTETAIYGRKISESKYWVWAKTEKPGEEWKNEDQSWIVDLNEGQAIQLKSRAFGVPYGPTIDHQDSSEKYFSVRWRGGWEGTYFDVEDVIERSTGSLVYSLELQDGVFAILEEGQRKLEVQFDPINGCEGNAMEPAQKVTVRGLNVNGTLVPFAQPRVVECIPNELMGSGFYPAFRYLVFSEGEGVFRIGLPWGGVAEFPVPGLDASTIRYK